MTSIKLCVGHEIFNLTYLNIYDYVIDTHSGSDFVFVFLEAFYQLEALQNVDDVVNASAVDVQLLYAVVDVDQLDSFASFGAKKFEELLAALAQASLEALAILAARLGVNVVLHEGIRAAGAWIRDTAFWRQFLTCLLFVNILVA